MCREGGEVNRGLARGESVAGGPERSHTPRQAEKLTALQNMLVWECVPREGEALTAPADDPRAHRGEAGADCQGDRWLSASAEAGGSGQGPPCVQLPQV